MIAAEGIVCDLTGQICISSVSVKPKGGQKIDVEISVAEFLQREKLIPKKPNNEGVFNSKAEVDVLAAVADTQA